MKKIAQSHGGAVSRFEKGESGNPKGRPKGSLNRATVARRYLELTGAVPEKLFSKLKTLYPDVTREMSIEEIMTLAQVYKVVVRGDTYAYNALLDSAYGKATQKNEISGEDGKPLPIIGDEDRITQSQNNERN